MFSKTAMREIIVRFVERRSFSKMQQQKIHGSLQERLIRAQQRLDAHRPALIATLDSLCEQYVTAKLVGDLATAKKLECLIEGIDTRLRIETPNFAAIVTAILYFSYRIGNMDSVAVGAQLFVKPCHIRQILARCRKLAGEKPAARGGRARLTREEWQARRDAEDARREERRAEREAQRAAIAAERKRAEEAERAERAKEPKVKQVRRKQYSDGLTTRQRWVRDGKCVHCGGKHGEKRDGKKTCAHCGEKFSYANNERQKARRAKAGK